MTTSSPASASALLQAGRPVDALAVIDAAVKAHPEAWPQFSDLHFEAVWRALYDAINQCDWERYDRYQRLLTMHLRKTDSYCFIGESAVASPFIGNDLQRESAELFCRLNFSGHQQPFAHRPPGQRLHIGFLGGDFYYQATSYLLTRVIECFNRDRFELHAYDFQPHPGDPFRSRVVRAFDHFTSIEGLSDLDAARRIHDDGIDVLIHMRDLSNGRLGIAAHRPCAVQIQYLYFPGTTGADFIDYLVADDIVIPPELESGYSEAILRLPGCYQPNDDQRPLPAIANRAAFGMSDQAILLANFSQSYKLTPDVFEVWCDLLRADDRRLLWLLDGGEIVRANLRHEAAMRDIGPDRLVFSPVMPLEHHLSRIRCADLVLDTFPYGGHTLASDTLWSGTPLVTIQGETFGSRVPSSLLHAVGLDELVAKDLRSYVELASALLEQPERLSAIRAMLEANRHNFALFNPRTYAQHFAAALEKAVHEVWHGKGSRSPASQVP